MMMVYFVMVTLCSGPEGCVEERKPAAYATANECLQTLNAFTPHKGVKYRCHRSQQLVISNEIRTEAQAQPHLITTNAAITP